jgi:hypothetical protein
MNYFPTDKSVDLAGALGPPWTDAGVDRGHGGALTGAWPPAAPVRQSSPVGAPNREGNEGNSARASPELGQRCGSRATVVQNREAMALGERKARAWRDGNRSGERCGEARGGCSSFIGAGERQGGEVGAVNTGVNGFNAIEGVKARRVMREGCKGSGASEARGSGARGAAARRNSDRGRPARGRR